MPTIYCDGVYDLFHVGHMNQLAQIKRLYPDCYLIVGVCNDEETRKNKGVTVMTFEERLETVKHCRYVDKVVEGFGGFRLTLGWVYLTIRPWTLTPEFIEKHSIDFVAHDEEPYPTADSEDVYGWLKKANKFIATKRTEGISTSDLILRILQNRTVYEERLVKRGYQL